MNFLKHVFVILILILGSQQTVFSGGVYAVKTLSIDEVSDTAVKAKKIAFIKAKKQAWINLLNDLSLLQTSDLPELDENSLNEIIQTIDIHNEKTRNNRYIASVSVYFNPKKVRMFFKEKGISFVEEKGFPVMVVPVYEKNGIHKIYELGNEWERALFNNPKTGGLLPVFLAVGGVRNSLKIDTEILKNSKRLVNVAKNYGTEGAVVARVSVIPVQQGYELILNWNGVGGFLDKSNDVLSEKVIKNKEDESFAKLTYKFYNSLEDKWRERVLLNKQTGQSSQKMLLSTKNIDDWIQLRENISNIETVDNITLLSIKGRIVSLNVSYLGERKKLKKTLERLGYTVNEKVNVWVVIRPKEGMQ